MRWAVLVLLVAAMIGGTARPAVAQPRGDDFAPCDDAASDPSLHGSLCARFAAPTSYADPTLGSVELFVRMFPADGRSVGRVWLVAGGPGESGASFYPLLPFLRAAFPGYDLIVPDHRGTGFSSRLCPAEEAADSPGGPALEGAEQATCFATLEAKSPRVQAYTISNAARDLSGLMARYGGDGRTLVYAVSYGTQLVLRAMIVAPPQRVDAIILDSLTPPETSATWDLSHRSAIVDAVGRKALAPCDADADCRVRLGGSAAAAVRQLESDPKASALFPDHDPKLFLGALLNSPVTRAMIPDVAAGALVGNAEPLAGAQGEIDAVATQFGRYPQSPVSIPLVVLISASENNARPGLTKDIVEAEAAKLLFTSSLPGQLVGTAADAYPRDEAFGKTPRRLPPVLVLQGDMDAKTPFEGAKAHVALLKRAGKVTFVTVHGGPHFLLLTAPDCFTKTVQTFVQKGRTLDSCSL